MEMKIMVGKEKNHEIIYCPKCGRKVAKWDKKSTIPIHVNCDKCQKRVVFNPETGEVKIKDIPERIFSSGVRYY